MLMKSPSGVVLNSLTQHATTGRRARRAATVKAWTRAALLVALVAATAAVLVIVGLRNAGLL